MEKRIEKLKAKIDAIINNPAPVVGSVRFKIIDESVQAELRLRAEWAIRVSVDSINYPKALSDDGRKHWLKAYGIDELIRSETILARGGEILHLPANAKTKSGAERRAAAEGEFRVRMMTEFLSAYKKAIKPRSVSRAHKRVEKLQAEQQEHILRLRAENSKTVLARRTGKAEERARDQEALKSGRFWEASKEAIKGFFHPPFSKNYLADVCGHWRAALYLEVESKGYKNGGGVWRHKLVATERAYLCGIDDNGDEWGHEVELMLPPNEHYDPDMGAATVEMAMEELFGVHQGRINALECKRQGDLLFCREKIPASVELESQNEPWEIRESHRIECTAPYARNGNWIRTEANLTVAHTSHQPVTLEPGDWRLYELQVADAD